MIDLETLATSPRAVILSIAGIRFNSLKDYKSITNPYDLDFFYCRVSTDTQSNRDISDETVSWWAKQDEEVKAEAFADDGRVDLNDAMLDFNEWAGGADRYWANGAAFDFPILETANSDLGYRSPWNYWQAMDARTIYKLVPNHYNPNKLKHHALYDCLNQIQKLTDCLKNLKVTKF